MSQWQEQDDFLARWLSDELSPREKAEFENSAEGKAYTRMIRAVDQLSAPVYDVYAELSRLKNKIYGAWQQKKTKTLWMQPAFCYAVAASITALVAATYFLLRSPLTTFTTTPGQQELVVLPGGSEVKMNAASTLSFNKNTWKEQRELTLEGEAFFQVARGSKFVVNTHFGAVTVLGTSFNIRTRGGEKLEVFCYTGKVNVSYSNANQDLLPGAGLRIEKGSVTKTWQKTEEEPGWVNGLTFFDDPGVPLGEAIEELVNIFGIKVLEASYPDSLTYRGFIRHSDVHEAIEVVMGQNSNFLKYEYDSENNTLRVLSIDP